MSDNQGFLANLLDYELILIIVGIILFFVVIGGFIYQLKKNRLRASYGAFLLIPLPFIGFPAIQTIKFMNGLFALEKATRLLDRDPQNQELRETLHDLVEEMEDEPVRSLRQQYALAEAHISLRELGEAEILLEGIEQDHKRTEINRARINVLRADQLIRSDPNASLSEDLNKHVEWLGQATHLSVLDSAALESIRKKISENQ